MAATFDVSGVGAGRTQPLYAASDRTQKVVTGTFAFDSSYPTGGEDASGIFNQFRTLKFLFVDQPLTGAQTGKLVKVDYTNRKLLLYTNASPAAEVANASDQSLITGVRFFAIGEM